ncbi:MAG: Stk1 family PASTA domain-containing Ser/Thr kinase [Clostridia bacterium]|nr:Stk1 family PASTA domain-containing Ser/Thr kinase [Clostridia bacterium]
MIGLVLDNRYKLTDFIGQGGMALVYKALDMRTHHAVAIKILKPEYKNDEEFLRRFEREAQAASKVSHHNIVNLLDVGAQDNYRYLVLEYVEGRTLKEIIDEKGALPPVTAVQIAIRLLSALQHMHKNGIIHRDIKPQNILIHADGHVKVSDFGIARLAGSGTISKSDMVMGSVHYFSPEQAQGQEVTEASDIYSAGVVLYEMLTGSVPFDGDSPVAIAMQHIKVPPRPVNILNPAVSPAINAVVQKAMAKDPKNRYQQAEDMARDLQKALSEPNRQPPEVVIDPQPEEAPPPRRTRRPFEHFDWHQAVKPVLMAAAALILTGILGLLAVRMYRSIANSATAPYVIDQTETNALGLIARAGLTAEISRVSNADKPAGTVIQQAPEFGTTMRQGSKILITVSTGPQQQEVPSLYGLSVSKATAELEKYGFTLLVLPDREVSEKPWDTVLRQTPEANTLMGAGGIVQVTLSGGSVTIPNLVGKSRAEALQLAESIGLRITEVLEEPVEEVDKDQLVAAQFFTDANNQPVQPGERVINGTMGRIVVYVLTTSAGEEP